MSKALETVTEHGEIISGGLPAGYNEGNQSLAVSLARAEVDQQIATARALPRSINRAVQSIMTLATLDEESAAECMYALPRGGKPIKGPSIRLAEIIATQWGNCRVGSRVVHVDRYEKFVEAEGVFHDLETNTAVTSRVRRRIIDKNGRLFTDDMIIVTGNAAGAIAKRNAILGGVPKAVWRKAYTAVESVIAGDVTTLVERRERALKAFAAFGVKPDQIYTALGITGLDDIDLEHITTLMGMHSALKSGESTVEEMFPRQPAPGERPKDLGDALDKLSEAKPADKLPPEATGEKNDTREPRHTVGGSGDVVDHRARTAAAQKSDARPPASEGAEEASPPKPASSAPTIPDVTFLDELDKAMEVADSVADLHDIMEEHAAAVAALDPAGTDAVAEIFDRHEKRLEALAAGAAQPEMTEPQKAAWADGRSAREGGRPRGLVRKPHNGAEDTRLAWQGGWDERDAEMGA